MEVAGLGTRCAVRGSSFLSRSAAGSARRLLCWRRLNTCCIRPGASTLWLRAARSENDVAQVTKDRQDLFDSISPVYDMLNDALSLGLHRVWKRMTVSWSGASQGDVVLDICCGSGDISFLLAEKVGPSGKVTGLDFSKDQLAMAKSRDAQIWTGQRAAIQWILGNALQLPFEPSTFDAITMGYGLRNVADIDLSLKEIYRVLKDGKSCAILDFNHSEDKTTDEVQSFMLQNVVVPIATQLGVAAQYEYLEPSIQRFPHGRNLEAMGRSAGFSRAVFYEIGFGLMGVLVLRK